MKKDGQSNIFRLRTIGRALAFQALHQLELNPTSAPDWQTELDLYDESEIEPLTDSDRRKALEFAKKLYDGVVFRKVEIDEALNNAFDKRRTLARTMLVDRSILRLAAYELTYIKTPKPVVISQAMELGKKFGDVGSAAFLNGVLDHLDKGKQVESQSFENDGATQDSSEERNA